MSTSMVIYVVPEARNGSRSRREDVLWLTQRYRIHIHVHVCRRPAVPSWGVGSNAIGWEHEQAARACMHLLVRSCRLVTILATEVFAFLFLCTSRAG